MILLTVGTQRFQFNRLLSKIDELIEKGIFETDLFAQIGFSTYKPQNYEYVEMIGSDLMEEYLNQSDFVITHSGTSSIIKALMKDKKVLVVPRQKSYEEHVDDHQIEIAKMFEQKKLVEVVYEIDELEQKIEVLLTSKYEKYINQSEPMLNDIKEYIEKII